MPNLLCSLMSCNITVLSLQYKYINNFMSVIPSSLAHADDAVYVINGKKAGLLMTLIQITLCQLASRPSQMSYLIHTIRSPTGRGARQESRSSQHLFRPTMTSTHFADNASNSSGQYQFSAQYIDAQLQQAVTTAGNVFGNDTKVAFPNAVAQSICKQYLHCT